MSTLKVNTIQNISGSNSSTPEQLTKGRAKVWWNYDHTTPSVTNSFNISSITDVATGKYTANFSITLTNPCGVTSASFNANAHDAGYSDITNCLATNTTASVQTQNAGAGVTGYQLFDCEFNYGAIFDAS